jgi:3-hydroxybutyryl-CoA dehydrogenase
MSIKIVGVIGAGVMGGGVAQNLAERSHRIILIDISQEILERAKSAIQKSIQVNRMLKKSERLESPDLILKRIEFSTDYERLEDADFIIENATEKWEIKKEIYKQIDKICRVNCVFAANTSAIPITRIASVTERAPNVLGIHFMNPVPMKSTVEIIRGYHTSDQTIDLARTLLTQMGKQGIVVNDSPGFVTNRVLMLTINEAICLLQDRVASAEDVDAIFRDCFGHKMGPLETADLIGLDTILYSIEVLYDSFNDGKYRPCPLLKKMVDAGLYGRKSGRGFYDYQ